MKKKLKSSADPAIFLVPRNPAASAYIQPANVLGQIGAHPQNRPNFPCSAPWHGDPDAIREAAFLSRTPYRRKRHRVLPPPMPIRPHTVI
jgi:hypothetical protein